MNKLFFLVLILSLVPTSHVKYLDESSKSELLIQADFQTVVLTEISGILPTFPTTLNVAEQSVPTFAGTLSNFLNLNGEMTLAGTRQKLKLGGIMEERYPLYPLTKLFTSSG